jgi:hypothetical protein
MDLDKDPQNKVLPSKRDGSRATKVADLKSKAEPRNVNEAPQDKTEKNSSGESKSGALADWRC